MGASGGESIGLYNCKSPENLTHIEFRQFFILGQHRDITVELSNNECIDYNAGKIMIFHCRFQQNNQYFRYDVDTQQIIVGPVRNHLCIDADDRQVIVTECDAERLTQKWNWGFVNVTMLKNWSVYGKKIEDEEEFRFFKRE